MDGKTVILGVSGGIAAYKSCELASRLTQRGVKVITVLTESARHFVTPLTFQALTQQPVHTSLWPETHDSQSGVTAAMAHIGLADGADAILIAPASANTIARLANGLADDLLSTMVLAARIPILLAPAMNPTMLAHPATQANLQRLRDFGYRIIEPESGRMACEHVGPGRLPETAVLIEELKRVLEGAKRTCDLEGRSVLITAGPTREAIDPVRYISNRSSGRMGYALAAAAAQRGARVTLISGPTQLPVPRDVERVDVLTTQEMFEAATDAAATHDIIIAAAAPADFAPAMAAPHKIKKTQQTGDLHLTLSPTPDIVAALTAARQPHQIIVGFAAETQQLVDEAQRKLATKNLDAIVANDVSQADAGFDVPTNRVTWVTASGAQEWPLLQKSEVADRILDEIMKLKDQAESV